MDAQLFSFVFDFFRWFPFFVEVNVPVVCHRAVSDSASM